MTSTASTTKPLPPVEQVRPGLWSIPVPLPIPLRYVFVYTFETDRGPFLVDAGWNTDDAFDALSAGLRQGGFEMSDVQGVMVTHIHPDHYGLAGRVRENSDAWIALHPADAALIHDRYEEPTDLLDRMGGMLRKLGAPASELEELRNASMPVRPFVDFVEPNVLMEDGDRPDMPGWDVTALWTPGHSPGHLCFWEASHRLMLTGDCVLPRITPNVNLNPQTEPDPLGDYLQSLERLAEFDAVEALPAHEWRYVGHRARLLEIRAHHEQRFLEVTDAVRAGYDTAWEVAPRMDWSRPWDQIDGFMRRSAIGEAYAHLPRARPARRARGIGGRTRPLEDRRGLSVDPWTMRSAGGWRRTPKDESSGRSGPRSAARASSTSSTSSDTTAPSFRSCSAARVGARSRAPRSRPRRRPWSTARSRTPRSRPRASSRSRPTARRCSWSGFPGSADLPPLRTDARTATMRSFADALAALHALDVESLALPGFPRPRTAEDHARLDLELWARLASNGVRRPRPAAPVRGRVAVVECPDGGGAHRARPG